MSNDKILEQGFDHPCRQTCSGWEQGRQRGQFDLMKDAQALADAVQKFKDDVQFSYQDLYAAYRVWQNKYGGDKK